METLARSIKFKVALAFAVCLVLIVAIGVFGLVGLSRLNSNMNASYSESVVPILALADVRAEQFDIRLQIRRAQSLRDPAQTKGSLEHIRAGQNRISKSWSDYYHNRASNDDTHDIADRINSLLPQFKEGVEDQVKALEAGNFELVSSIADKNSEITSAFDKALDDGLSESARRAKEFSNDSNAIFDVIRAIAVALICVGIVGATGAMLYLSREITEPLRESVNFAGKIASGQFNNRLEVHRRDEFGKLLESLKTMDEQLSQTGQGIRSIAESVCLGVGEIAAGNADLSARNEEQAASLEETASSMTELTETVKQNADNARQANALANRAAGIADAGDTAVQGMVGTIERLSGSSTKVSEITGVIEGIAFQTNILALNAAVEAARAGEQGRGFAVVASEVRSLAQRSAAAAKEIKELIGTSVAMIHDGAKQAAEAGSTMNEVKQAIKQVSGIVGEISVASDEQSRGIEQINQAVMQMDLMTQQNAALVEEAAAAARSLEEQATNLTIAMAVFKFKEEGSSASSVAVVPRKVAQAPAVPLDRVQPRQMVKSVETSRVAAVSPVASLRASSSDDWETF